MLLIAVAPNTSTTISTDTRQQTPLVTWDQLVGVKARQGSAMCTTCQDNSCNAYSQPAPTHTTGLSCNLASNPGRANWHTLAAATKAVTLLLKL